MKLKRISTDSIVKEASKDSTYCELSVNIGKWARDKQLEAGQKQVDKQFNPDWLQIKEHYEGIIRGIVKEHHEAMNELVGEILRWGIEQCQEHYTGGGVCSRRECPECWKALAQKYGVK